jgi:hypothetical protein
LDARLAIAKVFLDAPELGGDFEIVWGAHGLAAEDHGGFKTAHAPDAH